MIFIKAGLESWIKTIIGVSVSLLYRLTLTPIVKEGNCLVGYATPKLSLSLRIRYSVE